MSLRGREIQKKSRNGLWNGVTSACLSGIQMASLKCDIIDHKTCVYTAYFVAIHGCISHACQ